ncbi:MAG TPA: pectinesterase family protein [Prolixibacteraceae bacterium]|nr:pectinesterase family protein [Prolixibacteraceae bacterium]
MAISGVSAQTPAFPTAEGYGMGSRGGRGGKVVAVTTLEDDGTGNLPGSLRWALKQHPGDPITVVFRISGIIDLKGVDLRSKRNYVTLAGQTAPGDGICIRGAKCNFGGSTNLVIRHLRFRIGLKELENDSTEFIPGGSIGIENASNWIIDHCTFGWSGEENMTLYDNTLTTVQWCIVHEGLYDSGHGKGARSYGAQWGGQTSTYHHNLLANNVSRTPRVNGARSNDTHVLMDYVNNVNYNWGKSNSCYGSDIDAKGKTHRLNMINNYYKPGPARPGTSSSFFTQASFHGEQTTAKIAQFYMAGNYMEGSANSSLNDNNYLGLDTSAYAAKGIGLSAMISPVPFDVPYRLNTETAQEAYDHVLEGAGAFPRDAVDRRIVEEVRTGTVHFNGRFNNYALSGIIDQPSDAGGYPEYQTYNTITDNDSDGMDDAWETANGLDPTDPDDRNRYVQSGYTCLEVYLNSLVGEDIALDFTLSERKVHDFLVAKDGTGDFSTINEAIDAVPDDGKRYSIFIKKGIYEEKVFVGNRWSESGKIISMVGEHTDSVVISWNDYNGKQIDYPGKGTITADGMTCPTMTVTSPDFYMENITVKNPSTQAQAVALYQCGDRQVLKNCKILGNQDTHRTKKGKRYFFFRCTIEGGVDFIYAGGTCYFYQCNIVSNRGGYITAPEDITYTSTLPTGEKLRYGFIFKDCDVLPGPGVADGSVYLGRPWAVDCGSIFMNCRLGSHIHERGWQTWDGNEKKAFFAEYQSMNADGSSPVDVSKRVDWSVQLTTHNVNDYLLLSKIFAKVSTTLFDPAPIVVAPLAPESVGTDGNDLVWTPVNNATGYVVYANGSVIGFRKMNRFTDTLSHSIPPTYTIKTMGTLGNLSRGNGEREDFSIESINTAINTPLETTGVNERERSILPRIENGQILFERPSDLRIFTITGRLLANIPECTQFNTLDLPAGFYLFWGADDTNIPFSFKIRR